MSIEQWPEFSATREAIAQALKEDLPVDDLREIREWGGIANQGELLSYVFGALIEQGIEDPETLLREKGLIA